MAFTFDATTARGRVRLLLSDTDTAVANNQIFPDDEIDAFLAIENQEIYAAAAAGCESLSAMSARSAIRIKLERLLEIDRKEQPRHFRMLAEQYRKRSQAEPTEEIDSMEYIVDSFGEDDSEYVGDVVS